LNGSFEESDLTKVLIAARKRASTMEVATLILIMFLQYSVTSLISLISYGEGKSGIDFIFYFLFFFCKKKKKKKKENVFSHSFLDLLINYGY
jgi:hypothetical protein